MTHLGGGYTCKNCGTYHRTTVVCNCKQKTDNIQTAVEWLDESLQQNVIAIDHVSRRMILEINIEDFMELKNKAKQMEKEQMLNVFQESRLTHPMIGFKHQTFLEYYNEVYGGQGSPDTSPNTQNK